MRLAARTAGGPTLSNAEYVGLLEEYMGLQLSETTRAEIVRYCDGATVWERNDAVMLIMLAPEMHVA